MAYSYSEPLMESHTLATATFGTQTALVLPILATADMGKGNSTPRPGRVLNMARIIGLTGVVATAGTGTIQIGDGTTVGRYGTITLDSTVTAGNSVKASIELTEEGAHMGQANVQPTTTAYTLTFSGTAVVNNLKILTGHF